MRIGLYNLEPAYTNLALEKIRCYYKSHGHAVEYCSPIEGVNYDVVYCSSLFDWTDKSKIPPNFIKGGTGFYVWDDESQVYVIPEDIQTKLPPEIDAVEPHINKGFTSIGCPNKCRFCVVPIKEGDFKIVGDILSLWDGKSKLVVCYDNNIFASPEHFEHNAKLAIEHKITLDYNQGLDHRRLIPELVDIMKVMPHKEYHFAFDNPNAIASVEYAIDLLQSKGIMRCNWYVLCGFDTTFEQDLFRLNYLRSRNQNAYVQRFKSRNAVPDARLTALARWANQHHIFQGMTWEQFLKHPDNAKHYKNLLVEV